MEETNRVYRIRTKVGDEAPNVIHVPLNQTYDMFEILSLKLNQVNSYKTYESDYGVVVGRVMANGGFGIENAKVSVFIPVSDEDSLKDKFLYDFTSVNSKDNKGIRYNLLPDYVDDGCYQNVGTFPNKRLVLDNDDIIEMFDKYWKFTTRTNHSGDYMLFGIPVGSAQIHCDVDLSDCGILSQRPHDMMNKGYNATMFESPNKFKSSTNLNSLAQIVSQDKGIHVYPYWGDISDGDDKYGITRCDINLEYKFESYAVFIGSMITDKGSNAIGGNCTATDNNGKMSDLISNSGTIEMIRKTLDGKVEQFSIMGNKLIDGDGTFCYAIPMNLDYVTTDEFGNLVPTDNPDKGIATRTRVRFRFKLDDDPNDASARKRASYLVPNNPRMTDTEFAQSLEADYEFGSATREESYCDMFWNKVYTVKSYIPRLQKNNKEANKKHTGIKLINHHGDNNPMPYNSLMIKLGFTYRIICTITKIIINLIEFVNEIISVVGGILCLIKLVLDLPNKIFDAVGSFCLPKLPFIGRICPFRPLTNILKSVWSAIISPFIAIINMIMPPCIGLSSEFCDDGINKVTYYPGCGYFLFKLFRMPHGYIDLDCVWSKTAEDHKDNQLQICKNEKKSADECEMSLTEPSNETAMLYNCVENQLAQQNDAVSFNFHNDWVNGVLYAPLWHREITPKKSFFFGLFKRRAKDEWCSADRNYPGMRIVQHCTLTMNNGGTVKNFDGDEKEFVYFNNMSNSCDGSCHKNYTELKGLNGVIRPKQTMLGQTVYYYKAVEYDNTFKDVKLLFATDIVLLGSLNECDINGIPQFFKTLDNTTYNMPTDILFTDYDFIMTVNEKTGEAERYEYTVTDLVKTSEMAGCDWGNPNEFGKYDGGLFYSIGCTSGSIELDSKSCVNLSRICEYGVSLDATKEVANLEKLNEAVTTSEISDEVINGDTSGQYYDRLITDGFISYDELYNMDERSMFATMNGNRLKTKLNTTNGLLEYDFRYLYPSNFDGSMKVIMENRTKRYNSSINYKNNYKLEEKSKDYYLFRMGNNPFFYVQDNGSFRFPRYENSFYFYFGLKAGKTAIEKFAEKYIADCNNISNTELQIGVKQKGNEWCSNIILYKNKNNGNIITEEEYKKLTEEEQQNYEKINKKDGYVAFDLSGIATPYDILINGVSNPEYSLQIEGITEEKIVIYEDETNWEEVKDHSEYTRLNDNNGETVEMLTNGSYNLVITDNNGNITEYPFSIGNGFLSFDTNVQNFEQPNNVLLEMFGHDYDVISKDNEGIGNPPSNLEYITRNIGGVLTLYNIISDNKKLENYTIRLDILNGNIEWAGVELKKEGSQITTEGSVLYSEDGKHYAFGLPIGNNEYSVRVSQLCDGEEIGNTVVQNFTVSEPLDYKMYINDIDYDVIKYFDDKTGWVINDTTSRRRTNTIEEHEISIPTPAQDTLNMGNPWFHIEKIYYNNFYYENPTFQEFGVRFDDNNEYFTVYYTFENGETVDLNKTEFNDYVVKEFATSHSNGENKVYYNWVDDYIVSGYEKVKWFASETPDERTEDESNEAFEEIADFIDKVNNVHEKRKEIVSMMRETFYMMCESDTKQISVTGQTDKRPCTQTFVYHKEKSLENEEYNELDSDELIVETSEVNNGVLSDIRIPTITYKSSETFGDGIDDDTPCLAKSIEERIVKKPYSVGIMNNSGISIPKKSDGKTLTPEDPNGTPKYISETANLFKDLFSFPIIDKILKTDYIAWSSFVDIPQYGYENINGVNVTLKKTVNMNGLLSGYVYNGNITGSEYNRQTLSNIKLKLTDNLTNSETTYIEKRLINGYDTDALGNYAITLCKTILNQNSVSKVVTYLIDILGVSIKWKVSDGEGGYIIDNIERSDWKRIINKAKVQSGSFILSYKITLSDLREDYNTIQEWINYIEEYIILAGNGITLDFKFNDELTETTVTIGIDISKLEEKIMSFSNYIVTTNEKVSGTMQYAFVLPASTTLIIQDIEGCGITNSIDGELSIELSDESVNDCKNNNQVLKVESTGSNTYFSIFNAGDKGKNYPLNKAKLGEDSIIWKIDDEVSEVYSFDKPQNMFSFATKSSHLRGGENSLIDTNFTSETYGSDNYTSLVETRGYGTNGEFKRDGGVGYPVFIVAEDDSHCRALSPVYDYSKVFGLCNYGKVHRKTDNDATRSETVYRFGIAVKKNCQYYIDNYQYTLSYKCKIDNSNIIEVSEAELNSSSEYVYTEINEALYNRIKNTYINTLWAFYLRREFNNLTDMTIYDKVGLKHICYFDYDGLPVEKEWYSTRFKANLPEGEGEDSSIGIKENEGDSLSIELEIIRERNDNFPSVIVVEDKTTYFVGWSKTIGGAITTLPSKVIEESVYYGNWEKYLVVRFFESDETTEIGGKPLNVKKNTSVSPPEGYESVNWYVKGDTTKKTVDFSTYKIQEDTDFIIKS